VSSVLLVIALAERMASAGRDLDLRQVKDRLAYPNVVDGRNFFDPIEMKALGFVHHRTGRSLDSETERPVDDPEVRCPDISLAASRLGWKPGVSLHEGLQRTIAWAEGVPTQGGG
jgi:nucleoside-diphosphate-sugar epimerase